MARHDDLMQAARDETGLDDFGEDSFREGLERLCHSLDTEAHLGDIGGLVMPGLLTNLLSQRLQIEDWYKRHPEIDDEEIVAPLIGLGLPRTGSTALSFLLAEDPAARFLRQWEAAAPCPPPSTVEGIDPRLTAAEAQHAMRMEVAPRMAALLPSIPTGPEECQDLMALDFKAHYFQAFAKIPSYSSWLLDADLDSTYAYERRALKLLQWGEPTRPWRLKCPTHLLFLDHLDTSFPDARFVMTHRDPADVLLSVCDVYVEVGKMFGNEPDLPYIGKLNVEHWSTAMERVQAFRDAGHDDRFYDMDFRAVAADPIGEVRGLYEWLGEPVSDEFAGGMQRWWHDNAESREQTTHPDPAEFGLDMGTLREVFSGYTARAERWVADQHAGTA